MATRGRASVAASGSWVDDEDGRRLPSGEVHAWEPGMNQTACGLALSRSQLSRFAGVSWSDVQPESGGAADRVDVVCPRCAAAMGGRRRDERRWHRTSPRP
ncbi:MAG: hypothetical protein M3Q27_04600 [Actinomycetota bacterium]|nr:hypothetical protein [Actinomycetota bacterium]